MLTGTFFRWLIQPTTNEVMATSFHYRAVLTLIYSDLESQLGVTFDLTDTRLSGFLPALEVFVIPGSCEIPGVPSSLHSAGIVHQRCPAARNVHTLCVTGWYQTWRRSDIRLTILPDAASSSSSSDMLPAPPPLHPATRWEEKETPRGPVTYRLVGSNHLHSLFESRGWTSRPFNPPHSADQTRPQKALQWDLT